MARESYQSDGFIHKDKIHKVAQKLHNKFRGRLIILLTIFVAYIGVISGLAYSIYYYSNRMIPGVFVNQIDLSGKTIDESIEILNYEASKDVVITVKVAEKSTEIRPQDISFQFLIDETVIDAFRYGHSQNPFEDIKTAFFTLLTPYKTDFQYTYDSNTLDLLVSDIKLTSTDRYTEPTYALSGNNITIVSGKSGLDFDSHILQGQIINELKHANSAEIAVATYTSNPSLANEDLENKKAELNAILSKKIKVKILDDEREFDKSDILSFVKPLKNSNGEVVLNSNMQNIIRKVQDIALEVDREPSGQILKIENDRVVDFKPSLDGVRIKIKENSESIEKAIFAPETETKLELALEKTTAPSPDGNDYGIKEVIGVGTSKFVGSIPSRVHNVGLASGRVTGLLVAPGETFSFNKAVGEVSKKTGYKSAYVISGGRTILGDGGGLCQVSTTLFRAAINAGLKIVARSPHSYRVGYYEQDSGPGIDATVYNPSVDFKFLNDTTHHILVVSEFNQKKSTLKYTIYGTNDGRKVEVSEPKILSKKAPPSTVYEDDPSMPKGTTKQVEHAVAGAVVQFTRKVTRGDEVLYDDVFKSNYRAWPSVIKVGTAE